MKKWEDVNDAQRERLFLSWLNYASGLKSRCAIHMKVHGRFHSFWLDVNAPEDDRQLLTASMGSYGFPDNFGAWLQANHDIK